MGYLMLIALISAGGAIAIGLISLRRRHQEWRDSQTSRFPDLDKPARKAIRRHKMEAGTLYADGKRVGKVANVNWSDMPTWPDCRHPGFNCQGEVRVPRQPDRFNAFQEPEGK